MELSPPLLAAFPGLADDLPSLNRPPDPAFNCVARAAGVDDAWWWPADPDAFWPSGVPDELTVAAFVVALALAGYVSCPEGSPEPGFEKAAIYAKGGVPTHVARQLVGGRWTSKLGRGPLVGHASPAGVEGALYGSVAAYIRRPALNPLSTAPAPA